MPGFRAERIAEMVHRELDVRLREDIKDSRMVPISITSVVVSRDLKQAVISFMPLGGGEVDDELKKALVGVAKKLRGPIGRALRLRHAPVLLFQEDTHTEAVFRVNDILDKLRQARGEE